MRLRLEFSGSGITVYVEPFWEHEWFLGFSVLVAPDMIKMHLEWLELAHTLLDFLVDGVIILDCIFGVQGWR